MVEDGIPEAATLAEVLCEVVQWLSLGWKWQRWPCLSCSLCVERYRERYRGVEPYHNLNFKRAGDGGHDFL